jgi:hypothetical protein
VPPKLPPSDAAEIQPTADQVIDATLAPAPTPPRRSGALLPMIIGSALFMQNLDSTAIANALPTMARSLHQEPLVNSI